MSDLSEKALETAEQFQLDQVKERTEQARKRQCDEPRFASWNGVTCFDCGEDIPRIRINMGRVRCVHCQEIAERQGRS